MYEDAVAISRDLADAAITLSTQLRSMAMQIVVASRAASAGLNYQIPTARHPALAASYNAFSESALRFIFLIEHRRFIDPRIIVFRTAMNVVLHDTRELMYSQFVLHVMPALPTEAPNGELFPYNPPLPESADAIQALADRFLQSLHDAIMYTEDFLTEMQNLLLGDLFNNPIPPRAPFDPSCKVVTLEHAAEVEEWFNSNTAWGREAARVEAEIRKRFSDRTLSPSNPREDQTPSSPPAPPPAL